jgi:hypothetical protein
MKALSQWKRGDIEVLLKKKIKKVLKVSSV